MKTYGSVQFDADKKQWRVTALPHVRGMLKRIFAGGKKRQGADGAFVMPATGDTAVNLEWVTQRYPMTGDVDKLREAAHAYQHLLHEIESVHSEGYQPRTFELAHPAREYQRRGADVYLRRGFQLLADEVGLGKTVSSICALTDPRTLPAVVVCPVHLLRQWKDEIARFAPSLHTHILKKSTPYELPLQDGRAPDVVISTYHRIGGWVDHLEKTIKSVIFDEAQELRHRGTGKYSSCQRLCHAAAFKQMNTATPIYNMGGEIYSLVNLLSPDMLGTWDEFRDEWCVPGYGDKAALRDPVEFGEWLRDQHAMLRRTRKEVGRELPPVTRITHEVEADARALDDIAGAAGELARILMDSNPAAKGAKMRAAGEFDMMLRQATGIAKAPYVADFVSMLCENGEKVVLWGWHRAVYEIWKARLAKYKPVMYTGTESEKQKADAVAAFRKPSHKGGSDVFIMSLRSGTGLNGLQDVCSIGVVGELDWSPGVLEQCYGRLWRDGQAGPVTVFHLISEEGSDPPMVDLLGLKAEQVEGLIGSRNSETVLEQVDHAAALRKLAAQYLDRHQGA